MNITLQLNGEKRTLSGDGSEPLLDVLRRHGYTGPKRGCRSGKCGFCTVSIDGSVEKACLRPLESVEGATVETIAALGTQDDLHPVQEAFIDHSALQCGFCIPGMIMRAKGLLDENPDPSRAEIRDALSDNLCRCTGYEKIIDAVEDAAGNLEPEVAADGGRSLSDIEPSGVDP
jgi:carbon-monoxide dehydrogenase small subunit